MATTDQTIDAQRPLAEYAYSLKKKYNVTHGISKKKFMMLYDLGEVELSTVWENLFVTVRNKLGMPTRKESGDNYDFVKVFPTQTRVLGDMKTTVLQKDGDKRRFVVAGVENKIGIIYIVCWNWMTKQVNFFAIPPDDNGNHPKCGYKIPVCPKTGERTGGWYNDNCACESFEELVKAD